MEVKKRLNLLNTIFLSATHVAGLIGLPLWGYYFGFSPYTIGLFAFYMVATGISVTAGYHRLFSHRSYETIWPVKVLFLIFGGVACENSAIKWSADHRDHHNFTETPADPYNINKGFWFAHIGWIFYDESDGYNVKNVPDLIRDKLVIFQHKYYLHLIVVVGFLIPAGFGYYFGGLKEAFGALLLVGATRTVLVHHCTFFINSLCHYLGKQTYSGKITARDSWFMAILTYGEGYHNFHHKFQTDYRNGVRWWQYDPTKWLIRVMSFVGLAKNLRRSQELDIFRARIVAEADAFLAKVSNVSASAKKAWQEKLEAQANMLISVRARLDELKAEYERLLKSALLQKDAMLEKIRREIADAKRSFALAQRSWQLLLAAGMSQTA
jgi:stearoyl-CoA desaturase (delta-9 desaturase)